MDIPRTFLPHQQDSQYTAQYDALLVDHLLGPITYSTAPVPSALYHYLQTNYTTLYHGLSSPLVFDPFRYYVTHTTDHHGHSFNLDKDPLSDDFDSRNSDYAHLASSLYLFTNQSLDPNNPTPFQQQYAPLLPSSESLPDLDNTTSVPSYDSFIFMNPDNNLPEDNTKSNKNKAQSQHSDTTKTQYHNSTHSIITNTHYYISTLSWCPYTYHNNDPKHHLTNPLCTIDLPTDVVNNDPNMIHNTIHYAKISDIHSFSPEIAPKPFQTGNICRNNSNNDDVDSSDLFDSNMNDITDDSNLFDTPQQTSTNTPDEPLPKFSHQFKHYLAVAIAPFHTPTSTSTPQYIKKPIIPPITKNDQNSRCTATTANSHALSSPLYPIQSIQNHSERTKRYRPYDTPLNQFPTNPNNTTLGVTAKSSFTQTIKPLPPSHSDILTPHGHVDMSNYNALQFWGYPLSSLSHHHQDSLKPSLDLVIYWSNYSPQPTIPRFPPAPEPKNNENDQFSYQRHQHIPHGEVLYMKWLDDATLWTHPHSYHLRPKHTNTSTSPSIPSFLNKPSQLTQQDYDIYLPRLGFLLVVLSTGLAYLILIPQPQSIQTLYNSFYNKTGTELDFDTTPQSPTIYISLLDLPHIVFQLPTAHHIPTHHIDTSLTYPTSTQPTITLNVFSMFYYQDYSLWSNDLLLYNPIHCHITTHGGTVLYYMIPYYTNRYPLTYTSSFHSLIQSSPIETSLYVNNFIQPQHNNNTNQQNISEKNRPYGYHFFLQPRLVQIFSPIQLHTITAFSASTSVTMNNPITLIKHYPHHNILCVGYYSGHVFLMSYNGETVHHKSCDIHAPIRDCTWILHDISNTQINRLYNDINATLIHPDDHIPELESNNTTVPLQTPSKSNHGITKTSTVKTMLATATTSGSSKKRMKQVPNGFGEQKIVSTDDYDADLDDNDMETEPPSNSTFLKSISSQNGATPASSQYNNTSELFPSQKVDKTLNTTFLTIIILNDLQIQSFSCPYSSIISTRWSYKLTKKELTTIHCNLNSQFIFRHQNIPMTASRSGISPTTTPTPTIPSSPLIQSPWSTDFSQSTFKPPTTTNNLSKLHNKQRLLSQFAARNPQDNLSIHHAYSYGFQHIVSTNTHLMLPSAAVLRQDPKIAPTISDFEYFPIPTALAPSQLDGKIVFHNATPAASLKYSLFPLRQIISNPLRELIGPNGELAETLTTNTPHLSNVLKHTPSCNTLSTNNNHEVLLVSSQDIIKSNLLYFVWHYNRSFKQQYNPFSHSPPPSVAQGLSNSPQHYLMQQHPLQRQILKENISAWYLSPLNNNVAISFFKPRSIFSTTIGFFIDFTLKSSITSDPAQSSPHTLVGPPNVAKHESKDIKMNEHKIDSDSDCYVENDDILDGDFDDEDIHSNTPLKPQLTTYRFPVYSFTLPHWPSATPAHQLPPSSSLLQKQGPVRNRRKSSMGDMTDTSKTKKIVSVDTNVKLPKIDTSLKSLNLSSKMVEKYVPVLNRLQLNDFCDELNVNIDPQILAHYHNIPRIKYMLLREFPYLMKNSTVIKTVDITVFHPPPQSWQQEPTAVIVQCVGSNAIVVSHL